MEASIQREEMRSMKIRAEQKPGHYLVNIGDNCALEFTPAPQNGTTDRCPKDFWKIASRKDEFPRKGTE
jgi:hypothetical protein